MQFIQKVAYRNIPSLRYVAYCRELMESMPKYQRYIYNPKWFKFGPNKYKYKIYGNQVADDIEVMIFNNDFAVKATFGAIKKWFAWHREKEIKFIMPKELYQYAYHWELWAKYSEPMKYVEKK